MLAIVIPYYKLTFFEETLQSLANQTDKRFKVYIGDDASPENPEQLLAEYKDSFPFSYHKFDENMGGNSLVVQWERCIALTQNEQWIMILGDDDYLDQQVIANWYLNLPVFEGKSNVIRYATKTVNQQRNSITEAFKHPQWELSSDSWFRRFKELTRSSLSEYVFSKQLFLKHRFRNYPLAWHSDDVAWLDFANGKPIFSINESVVYIRMSEFNISGKKDNQSLKNEATVLFLKDVINDKAQLFSKLQLLEILMAFEIAVKKCRKLNASEWKMLLSNYLRASKIIPLVKFFRRFFISIKQ